MSNCDRCLGTKKSKSGRVCRVCHGTGAYYERKKRSKPQTRPTTIADAMALSMHECEAEFARGTVRRAMGSITRMREAGDSIRDPPGGSTEG